MSKFLTILRREYAQIVKKKSFIIGIFVTPIFMGAIMILPAMLASKESSTTEYMAVIDRDTLSIGQQFTESLDRYKLPDSEEPAYIVKEVFDLSSVDETAFTGIYDSLVNEISEKNLKYFLLVDRDAPHSDTNLTLVTNTDDFRAVRRFENRLSDILSSYRLEMSAVNLPVDSVLTLTRGVDLPIRDTTGESTSFLVKFFASMIFVLMVYMMILVYGQTLMRSVIEEKTSRIMEVLISSVTPLQLMLGKVLGMGLAAFTQVAVWVAAGLIIFLAGGSTGLEIDPSIGRMAFNPLIVSFFVLFFLSGYILYSTLFALIGSIVNSDKEAQNFLAPIVICLIIPLVVGAAVARDPYMTWVLVLSYIPLFAPTMMLQRVVFLAPTATEYSFFSGILGEATLSLLLVIISTFGVIWLTAKIFRVGILMYGKRPTLPEIIKWVRH